MTKIMDASHLLYMQETVRLAAACASQNEVPVGAVLVRENTILSTSINARESSQNPLAHAEAHCIQLASKALGNWRLENTTLYVSMEPCLMCTGLIYASRIPRVVFGCKNPKGGSLIYIQERRKELNLNHSVEVISGVLEDESAQLLKDFFKNKRI